MWWFPGWLLLVFILVFNARLIDGSLVVFGCGWCFVLGLPWVGVRCRRVGLP